VHLGCSCAMPPLVAGPQGAPARRARVPALAGGQRRAALCGGGKVESAWQRSSGMRASARAGATLPESSVELRLDFLHVVETEACLPERCQGVGNGQLALWLVAVSPQRGSTEDAVLQATPDSLWNRGRTSKPGGCDDSREGAEATVRGLHSASGERRSARTFGGRRRRLKRTLATLGSAITAQNCPTLAAGSTGCRATGACMAGLATQCPWRQALNGSTQPLACKTGV